MTGRLLVRGMLAGLAAGLVAFCVAWALGEPQIDLAIAFEDHVRRLAGEPEEPELVSRAVQSTIGLFTAVMVYGAALGGLFAIAFSVAYGRLGRLGARATAAFLAGIGFLVLVLVPQLQYPANPPAIGNPDTIGTRTAMYFGMLALSLGAAIAAIGTGRQLVPRLGPWNAALAGIGAYLLAMIVAMSVLPALHEVPASFSAPLLWRFRLASLGIGATLWTGISLVFGPLAERCLEPGARRGSYRQIR